MICDVGATAPARNERGLHAGTLGAGAGPKCGRGLCRLHSSGGDLTKQLLGNLL